MAQGYDVVSRNYLHHYKVFHTHKQRDTNNDDDDTLFRIKNQS